MSLRYFFKEHMQVIY